MKKIFSLLLLLVVLHTHAQSPVQPFDDLYARLQKSFVANNAYQTVAYVEQRWRIAGNTGFNESIYYVEKILQQAGYKKEVNGEADGPLTYRIETRKMKRPTWEPITASLTIDGESTPLLKFETNRNMIAINSASTPTEGINAEVVYVGKGTPADFKDKDVKGKIVLGETSVGFLYKNAMDAGAIGVLAYAIPDYNQPTKHVNSIQFQGIPYKEGNQQWGILLSHQAKERLKAALEKGTLRVNVKISSRTYESDELTLVANARGTTLPDERFVFSAHVQEPGANDNATGVGTLAEMARVTAELIQNKQLHLNRTITFLWGDEIVSTNRYIVDDEARAKGIKWGLSLDMVGEDVSKTGGTFLIEKMPDPSAIWTRGEEKHSEWGGEALTESQMFPHYFNDLLLNRCLQQAKTTGWIVKTNPFEGGSDHTPFLKAKIPGLLMWHFTDVYYHTDADRLEMVSAKEMKNVGVSALATASILCSADEKTALTLVEELEASAINRLNVEFKLSLDAVHAGNKPEDEKHILEVWTDYYVQALGLTTDIRCGGTTAVIDKHIGDASGRVKKHYEKLVGELK